MQPALCSRSFLFCFKRVTIQTDSIFKREDLLLLGFFFFAILFVCNFSDRIALCGRSSRLNLPFLQPQLAFCWDYVFTTTPWLAGFLFFWCSDNMPRNKGSLEVEEQSWSLCLLQTPETSLAGHGVAGGKCLKNTLFFAEDLRMVVVLFFAY